MDRAVSAIMFALASVVWSYRALRALQMNGYRLSLSALKPQAVRIAAEYTALVALGVASAVASGVSGSIGAALGSLIIIAVYGVIDAKRLRTPLKMTPRAIRLTIASSVSLAGLQIVSALASVNVLALTIAGFACLICTRSLTAVINTAIRPFENINNKRYIKAAKDKIDGLRAVKIGITGSYGKTSCKNILAEMLGVKYKVIKTEKNYNTPLGIARTVQKLTGDEEVFIAEMGARRQGEIRELAELVRPKYAIITGVSPQHLATFKSEESIYSTKKELIDSLPQDGFAVFNGDNGYTRKMAAACPVRCTAVYTGDAGDGSVYADGIQLTNNGSRFSVKGLGEDFVLTTRLLGRHNILNILMCFTLALELGVDKNKLIEAVKELKPVPHRLELLDTKGGITVIDDSYNGNLEGIKFALEVLSLYKDKRRVVFTQGIVELGKKQSEINKLVGAMVAEVADAVILTGENAVHIKTGLLDSGYRAESIHVFKGFKEAQEALKTLLYNNDVLLIQNDIP